MLILCTCNFKMQLRLAPVCYKVKDATGNSYLLINLNRTKLCSISLLVFCCHIFIFACANVSNACNQIRDNPTIIKYSFGCRNWGPKNYMHLATRFLQLVAKRWWPKKFINFKPCWLTYSVAVCPVSAWCNKRLTDSDLLLIDWFPQ